jgi:hypothetical protein
LVDNEQQSLLVRQAAGRLTSLYDRRCFVEEVNVWNQSEFKANIVGLGKGVNYVVRDTLAFTDARVTRLVHIGTRQEDGWKGLFSSESYYEQVHALLTDFVYDEHALLTDFVYDEHALFTDFVYDEHALLTDFVYDE